MFENDHGPRIRGAELFNVTFKNSKFIGALLGDSYYEDVQFINVTMEPYKFTPKYNEYVYQTSFINSTFNQVDIGQNSTLIDTQFKYLQPSSLLSINHSNLKTEEAEINYTFASSHFRKLLIDNCKVSYNSFGFIKGNGEIIIRNSKLSNITSNGIHANTVRLENNVAYEFRLSGWINKILARNNKIYGTLGARVPNNSKISTILSSGNSTPPYRQFNLDNASLIVVENDTNAGRLLIEGDSVKKIIVMNSTVDDLFFSTKIPVIEVSDSNLNQLSLYELNNKNMFLKNVRIEERVEVYDSKVDNVIFESVELNENAELKLDAEAFLKQGGLKIPSETQ